MSQMQNQNQAMQTSSICQPAVTHCTSSTHESYALYRSCVFQVLWSAGTHCTNSIYGVLYPVHVMCFPGPLASYLITKTTHRRVALLGSVMVVLGMLLMPFLPYIPALCISFGVLSGNHHLSNVNQSYHVACYSVGGWVCLLVCVMLYHIFVVVEGNQSENGSWSKL